VEDVDGAPRQSRRKVGRLGKSARLADMVKRWLTDEPKLLSPEILGCMKRKGYEGGRTTAYGPIRGLRERVNGLVMRFEGLPGEFTQHDVGEARTRDSGHAPPPSLGASTSARSAGRRHPHVGPSLRQPLAARPADAYDCRIMR
jgi:hypothetical protein